MGLTAMNGRFAPSPTSGLHLGNLRTALAAWLFARSSGRGFVARVEDLDRDRVKAADGIAAGQLADLAALGIDFDGAPLWQSDRLADYERAAAGLELYECFCTRKEIAEAALAPHGDHRPYPGTCRDLTPAQRDAKRARRPPAWRVKVPAQTTQTVRDYWAGESAGAVDDFVVRRNDGTWAYNFAVVVDDIAQGVDQVVRGADLLSSAPRQAWLTGRLGGRVPEYAHIGLVVSPGGERLSKRDAAVTLSDLAADGWTPGDVLALLGASLGLASPGERVTAGRLLERFDPALIPPGRWVWNGQRTPG
ncbi:MAG: tRNA glutamyl-Q(34) synthetase GluQRS [Propionibacteriaceae bacterium]|jgi:glutamyl-tRNA synthetase|nr:tRNA glutamyl-Q(34) synthetase GluQRS [Propionibacteriaceae bacterium]